jgi:alkanesulfonate monooxygenase SsuD/methylene tetrahydromethanopterin reductase-like flavin-dependent oxidoreductase (luciferase family)
MRLAGEIADIALVGARNLSHSSVANYKQWLAEGADRAGRDVSEVKIAPRVTLCVSEDSKLAHSSVKRYAAHYLEIVGENGPQVEKARKNQIFEALSRSRGWYFDHNRFDDPELESLVDDDLIREFAIVGTPQEVTEQLQQVLDLGFSQISCNLAAVRRPGNSMAEGLYETIKGSSSALQTLRKKN